MLNFNRSLSFHEAQGILVGGIYTCSSIPIAMQMLV